jgi:transcriptional regulator with PAS, ATPase and Fis domain
VAPNPHLACLASAVAGEYGNVFDIYEGNLAEGVRAAEIAMKNGSEIIISRGGTAMMIEKELNIPVVCIVFSGVDLVKTIEKAKVYDRHVALLGFENIIGELDGCYDFLSCKMCVKKLKSYEEIKESILNFYHTEKIRVFIGGDAVCKMAEELGFKGVIMECGIESIRRAVHEAKHLAEMKLNVLERYLQFKAISEYSSEGIILLDKEQHIKYINPMAQNLIAKRPEDVLGKPLKTVLPGSGMINAIYDNNPKIAFYEEINTIKIIANYVPLNVNNDLLGVLISFQDVTKIEELEKKIRREQYTKGLFAKYHFADVLTKNKKFLHILDNANRIAKCDSSVLIYGESGTGKELIAQSLHNAGRRRHGPFVAVNCAALPESLLESELFGYADGAFTGARKSGKPGLFELAHLGTIFLDEIGDIPLTVQSRLLRVIQEKEVTRIGDDRVIPVNIRIISATNKDLAKLSKNGQFRDDLFYRLDVVKIRIPPLRERAEDIPFFSEYFIEHYCMTNKIKIKSITKNALELLKTYSWPGNIRELQNFIESLVIICEQEIIDYDSVELLLQDKLDHVMFRDIKNVYQQNYGSYHHKKDDKGVLKKLEYQSIKEVLDQVHGDKAMAAQILGISTTTLWRRLKKISV